MESLKAIYNALAYAYLSYCVSIWGSTWKRYQNQVIIAQKRIIRTILYASRYDSSLPLFVNNKLLNFNNIRYYFCALVIHKFIHLGYCSDIFQHSAALRQTRNNVNTVQIPFFRTARGQQSIMYSASSMWNNLPNNIRSISNVITFKRTLKTYLYNNQTIKLRELN